MKHKKIVASLLITSLIITSAGFSALAATVETVANAHAKKFKEERIKLPFKYSNLLDNVCGRYLMGNDDIDEALKDKVPSKSASYSDADSDDEDDGVNTTYTDEPEEDGEKDNDTENNTQNNDTEGNDTQNSDNQSNDNKGNEDNTTTDDIEENEQNTTNNDTENNEQDTMTNDTENNKTTNDDTKTENNKEDKEDNKTDNDTTIATESESKPEKINDSESEFEDALQTPTADATLSDATLKGQKKELFGAGGKVYFESSMPYYAGTAWSNITMDTNLMELKIKFQQGGKPRAGAYEIATLGEADASWDGLYRYLYEYSPHCYEVLIYSPDLDIYLPSDSSFMFNNMSLIDIDLSCVNTSEVTNMDYMFSNCYVLPSLNLSNFDTSSVTSMRYMFEDCRSLTNLDLSSFDTNNVSDMSCMFNVCSDLVSIDLRSFDTSNVTKMGFMFDTCISLTSLDLSNFDTSNVLDMSYMFGSCRSLHSLDLNNFNTSNVSNMSCMFVGCASLSTIYSNNDFSTAALTDSTNMFAGCDTLVGGNGTKYSVALVDDASYAKVDRASVPGYFTKKVIPTSTPTPTPTTPRGGAPTPPGGGGGSSNRGGSLSSSNNGQGKYIDFVVHTVTNKSNIEWIYDAQGNKDGAKIKKESPLAKSLMGEAKHRNRYIDINDKDYIQLKSGYYKVELPAGGYYLGFDDKGKMIKGFIYTTEQTEDYNIDVLQSKLVEISTKKSAKYYLMKGTTEYAGIVWNIPIAIRDKAYYFDPQGRVTREEPLGQVNALSASQVITKGPIHIGNKVYKIDYEGALYEVH